MMKAWFDALKAKAILGYLLVALAGAAGGVVMYEFAKDVAFLHEARKQDEIRAVRAAIQKQMQQQQQAAQQPKVLTPEKQP
jgi:hypothetical protein